MITEIVLIKTRFFETILGCLLHFKNYLFIKGLLKNSYIFFLSFGTKIIAIIREKITKNNMVTKITLL